MSDMSKFFRIPLACVALTVALAGCTSNGDVATSPSLPPGSLGVIDPGARPAFDSALVRYMSYSGFMARTRLVVRDQATWESVWMQLTGGIQPKPPTPAVNFEKDMVLVAGMG